ncbi:unnamed protein product [Cochlearia groenlandica]
MCTEKEEEEEETNTSKAMNNIQNYQNDLFFHHLLSHHHHQEPSQPETLGAPVNNIGPGLTISPLYPTSIQDPLFPPPFFNITRPHHHQGLQFGYEGFGGATSALHNQHEQFRILSEAIGPVIQTGSGSYGFQGELLGKMTTHQEMIDAKALAASKSHSEAERRRRERINNHFTKLRSILPNTTKTDKASLLAEVIQHVKELKKETLVIEETSSLVPTENNELTVAFTEDNDGRLVIKTTICCEDRFDLLQDMIKTLKALRLKTLKAEIITVGERVKNVLFVTRDEEGEDNMEEYCVETIEEALKVVMEKNNLEETSSSANVKRQRINSSH